MKLVFWDSLLADVPEHDLEGRGLDFQGVSSWDSLQETLKDASENAGELVVVLDGRLKDSQLLDIGKKLQKSFPQVKKILAVGDQNKGWDKLLRKNPQLADGLIRSPIVMDVLVDILKDLGWMESPEESGPLKEMRKPVPPQKASGVDRVLQETQTGDVTSSHLDSSINKKIQDLFDIVFIKEDEQNDGQIENFDVKGAKKHKEEKVEEETSDEGLESIMAASKGKKGQDDQDENMVDVGDQQENPMASDDQSGEEEGQDNLRTMVFDLSKLKEELAIKERPVENVELKFSALGDSSSTDTDASETEEPSASLRPEKSPQKEEKKTVAETDKSMETKETLDFSIQEDLQNEDHLLQGIESIILGGSEGEKSQNTETDKIAFDKEDKTNTVTESIPQQEMADQDTAPDAENGADLTFLQPADEDAVLETKHQPQMDLSAEGIGEADANLLAELKSDENLGEVQSTLEGASADELSEAASGQDEKGGINLDIAFDEIEDMPIEGSGRKAKPQDSEGEELAPDIQDEEQAPAINLTSEQDEEEAPAVAFTRTYEFKKPDLEEISPIGDSEEAGQEAKQNPVDEDEPLAFDSLPEFRPTSSGTPDYLGQQNKKVDKTTVLQSKDEGQDVVTEELELPEDLGHERPPVPKTESRAGSKKTSASTAGKSGRRPRRDEDDEDEAGAERDRTQTAALAQVGQEYMAYHENELVKLSAIIRNLREDREHLLKRIEILENERVNLGQENIGLKAELDEVKIELGLLKKRHMDEAENLKYQVMIAQNKRELLEEQNKNFQHEFERLRQKVKVDFRKIKEREKELENQLELLRADSQIQVSTRDQKILELKRQIDSMEFDMENMLIHDRKIKEDQIQLQDKLDRVMKTLRTGIHMLEKEDVEVKNKDVLKKLKI